MATPPNAHTSTGTMPEPHEGNVQTPPPLQKLLSVVNGWIIALAAFMLALVFCVGLFAGWQFGFQSAVGQQWLLMHNPGYAASVMETRREQTIAAVLPSVVQINVTGANNSSSNASGVIVDQRGYIVTNYHVIAGAASLQVVLYNGQTLPAKLIGTAEYDDLAVIKVDSTKTTLSAISLGDSSALRVGQEVMVIGNPLGITQTVTCGIVSALGRNLPKGNGLILPSTIQTDAAINPGNSGGALVDMDGHLVGITTLTAIDPESNTPAKGVGFAIPSNRVQFIVPQLITDGHVTHTGRAALEAQVVDVDPMLAQQDHLPITQGALVVNVMPKGAAAQAGLRRGDIIVQVGDKNVTNVLSLSDALIHKDLGDMVVVKVYRGTQLLALNVTLGELPAK
jgi:S1-C subfamily serine protease